MAERMPLDEARRALEKAGVVASPVPAIPAGAEFLARAFRRHFSKSLEAAARSRGAHLIGQCGPAKRTI